MNREIKRKKSVKYEYLTEDNNILSVEFLNTDIGKGETTDTIIISVTDDIDFNGAMTKIDKKTAVVLAKRLLNLSKKSNRSSRKPITE